MKNRGENLAKAAEGFIAANSVPLDPALSARSVQVTLPVTNPLFLAVAGSGSFAGYYQFTQLSKGLIPGLDQVSAGFAPIDEALAQLPQVAPVAQTTVSRVSIGTAFYPDDGDAIEALLAVADRTMYSAKQRAAAR